MADVAGNADDRALDALTKILESAISPDMLEAQKIILRRLALAGDLFPSRVPAPLNITQVGGYLNLLVDQPELLAQVLAATLGVAGPNPSPGWEPTRPALFFASRPNDRPAGPSQAATPVELSVRSDLVAPLEAALATIRARGCALPLLAPLRALPPYVTGGAPPDDVLALLGRVLETVAGAALVDPTTDPLAVGTTGGAGSPTQVVARQLDAAAPDAASVIPAAWNLWACTATACTPQAVTGAYLPLTPILNGAGWYQPALTAPTSLAAPGVWARWTNVTGLIGGRTRVRDELLLLYSAGEVAQSAVRDRLDWVWNGTAFAATA